MTFHALYLQDIGGSVGYRLAVRHPERVTAPIIQNGEAYLVGINHEFAKPGSILERTNRRECKAFAGMVINHRGN